LLLPAVLLPVALLSTAATPTDAVGAEVQSVVVPSKATEPAPATATAAASPDFEAVIRREEEATIKAFNAADANGMAALFMEKGELVDENGNVYTGREEIAAVFKSFFAKFPQAALAMDVTSVRTVGDSLAIEEGVRQITAGEGAVAAQVRYVAVRDKVGNNWPIASYREFGGREPRRSDCDQLPLERGRQLHPRRLRLVGGRAARVEERPADWLGSRRGSAAFVDLRLRRRI
jgi:uncharacterized protein (TIGR02246 family)